MTIEEQYEKILRKTPRFTDWFDFSIFVVIAYIDRLLMEDRNALL